MGVNVAVVGVTGAVGTEMLKVLERRDFPVDELRPLASSRSAGKNITFRGKDVQVQELTADSFEGINIGLFSAGGSISKEFVPYAIDKNCVVVDNTSAFRMDEGVPLVVPEVNANRISEHNGVIANPNCSTIQLVSVLKPIHDAVKIRRVVVSTYQAVSGAGYNALVELKKETEHILSEKSEEFNRSIFPHQIAFNALPQLPQSNAFHPNGYTDEEMKMINETKKILEDSSFRITTTTVRVPVYRGHSESVNIETVGKLSADQARDLLSKAEGVVVIDDPSKQLYPLATDAAGKDETFVGRIREDDSVENGLNMWVVSDNLLKGAALNAVQIAEKLI
ncbi:MAG: Aspartate-semialdehyde dehydrogenase [Candidatus Scalindua arabica]|uniref:Aspartate-semialdehyde dehydrogenase n=1 Tax=Candidatus Scalindua arabica TaxID=1127984 RepID=A0A941W5X7_9BACT|nr:Aspartate-semialdehyde dehydrogenase [Candidatus Scalindua arabica]